MSKVLLFYIFLALGFSQFTVAQTSINSWGKSVNNFQEDLIVLKFKTPKTTNGRVSFSHDTQLEKLKKIIDYVDHYQIFANKSISSARSSSSGLQNIYRIRLKSGSNIWNELTRLNQLDFIEYAEPLPQNELLFIPNDPQADPDAGLQDYLTVIKAYEGWQIDQSDSSLVI